MMIRRAASGTLQSLHLGEDRQLGAQPIHRKRGDLYLR
jgi:hypothetical protein